MAVYVDELVEHPTGAIQPAARRWGNLWCHLFADTAEELHEFAARIGMKRSWFQGHHKQFPHYDIIPSRRKAALKAGAQEVKFRDVIRLKRAHGEGVQ